MITEEHLENLNRSFKRIFALPLSRMTVKECQNALGDAFSGKVELARAMFESLLKGELVEALKNSSDDSEVSKFIECYSPLVSLAKEVGEFGELLNSFSCDFVQQGNQIFFTNRMRRLDGKEYHFLSAPDMNIRLAHMFIQRLHDLKNSAGEGIKIDSRIFEELRSVKNDIDALLEK